MTKRNYYAEKTIAVFLIIFGVVSLFVLIYGQFIVYNFALSNNIYSWKDISFLKLVEIYHSGFILDILTIIGGLLLLLNKKSGWVLTLVTSITRGLFCLINLYSLYFSPSKSVTNATNLLIMNFVICLVFFLISSILISKTFKLIYKPKIETWRMIIIFIVVLVVDKIIFQLML